MIPMPGKNDGLMKNQRTNGTLSVPAQPETLKQNISAPHAQSTDLGELTRELLENLVPTEEEGEDISSALGTLGWRRTGAAMLVFCLWQKACRGDVSAAKFIRDLSLERAEDPENEETDPAPEVLSSMSDAELLKLLGKSFYGEKADGSDPGRKTGAEKEENHGKWHNGYAGASK